MDKIINGDAAFPNTHVAPQPDIGFSGWYGSSGMTLRDWFAGQALVGILSCRFSEMIANVPESARYSLVATDAFLIADAMLAEREKSNA